MSDYVPWRRGEAVFVALCMFAFWSAFAFVAAVYAAWAWFVFAAVVCLNLGQIAHQLQKARRARGRSLVKWVSR